MSRRPLELEEEEANLAFNEDDERARVNRRNQAINHIRVNLRQAIAREFQANNYWVDPLERVFTGEPITTRAAFGEFIKRLLEVGRQADILRVLVHVEDPIRTIPVRIPGFPSQDIDELDSFDAHYWQAYLDVDEALIRGDFDPFRLARGLHPNRREELRAHIISEIRSLEAPDPRIVRLAAIERGEYPLHNNRAPAPAQDPPVYNEFLEELLAIVEGGGDDILGDDDFWIDELELDSESGYSSEEDNPQY